MKKLIALTSLIAMASATAAFATSDDVKDAMKKMCDAHFKEADTNKDDKLSKEEHDTLAAKMFSEADTNGDKSISKEEQTAMRDKQMSKMDEAK